MNNEQLKSEVKNYWNKASCGTDSTQKEKHSTLYFQEIEAHRYAVEAEIFAFAQFTRFYGKRVLEVGVGAGTDFLQWVRAGAQAYGVDLTPEAIDNTKACLKLYNLQATDLQIADAENLPYPDNFFDLVYSWGVIHHSPDTEQCLAELIRVTKPNGIIKFMVYNRYSFFSGYLWLIEALFKGRPFQSLTTILHKHQESLGTKGYTHSEIKNMLIGKNAQLMKIDAPLSSKDFMNYRRAIRYPTYLIASLLGWSKLGWRMKVELKKESNK